MNGSPSGWLAVSSATGTQIGYSGPDLSELGAPCMHSPDVDARFFSQGFVFLAGLPIFPGHFSECPVAAFAATCRSSSSEWAPSRLVRLPAMSPPLEFGGREGASRRACPQALSGR